MKTIASNTYICGNGHAVASKEPLTSCPAYIYGNACPAELEPVSEQRWWQRKKS